jgi:hypothetical protein
VRAGVSVCLIIKSLGNFWSFFDLARIIDGEAAILTIIPNEIRWLLGQNEIHPQQFFELKIIDLETF